MKKWYEVVLIVREVRKSQGKGFIDGLMIGDYGNKKDAKIVYKDVKKHVEKIMK